jgi:hypothetical protein
MNKTMFGDVDEPKTKETPKYKTIEFSLDTYERFCGVKAEMEELFKTKVSFDTALKCLLSPKLIDYTELLP